MRWVWMVVLAAVVVGLGMRVEAGEVGKAWRGVHVMLNSDGNVATLMEQVPKLAEMGVNVLLVEVNYSFQFQSHPELGNPKGISKKGARELAEACEGRGIRVIPLFNCLGHQSWSKQTFTLLTKHPEFDETPGQYPENKGIYCRSWCPLHPEVNRVVFALMDELIDAFKADALHVGMDEVFLIGSPHCVRCKGKNPAELFAKAVNDYHQHLTKDRKVEMLMWGDRLLDAKTMKYGEWESAANGTAGAIDMIPKDIVMCDWHYVKQKAYPSIPFFIEKGFRVWPAGWDKVEATEALIDFAQQQKSPLMLGHLCTTWGTPALGRLAEWPPIVVGMKRWEGGKSE